MIFPSPLIACALKLSPCSHYLLSTSIMTISYTPLSSLRSREISKFFQCLYFTWSHSICVIRCAAHIDHLWQPNNRSKSTLEFIWDSTVCPESIARPRPKFYVFCCCCECNVAEISKRNQTFFFFHLRPTRTNPRAHTPHSRWVHGATKTKSLVVRFHFSDFVSRCCSSIAFHIFLLTNFFFHFSISHTFFFIISPCSFSLARRWKEEKWRKKSRRCCFSFSSSRCCAGRFGVRLSCVRFWLASTTKEEKKNIHKISQQV